MYIPNDMYKVTPSVDCNQGLKRLDNQLIETTNQNSMKPPKLLSQRIRKCYYKTLGTSIINISVSPPSLSGSKCADDMTNSQLFTNR